MKTYSEKCNGHEGCFTIGVHNARNHYMTSLQKINSLVVINYHAQQLAMAQSVYSSEETV